MDLKDVICLDTETTGLKFGEDEILQLSIIRGDSQVLFSKHFRPEKHTEWKDAQSVNGITPQMVEHCPTFKEMLRPISWIVNDYKLIVGYNISFDLNMLRSNGLAIRDDIKTFDVMKCFSEIYGEWSEEHNGFKWKKLSVCAEYFGIKFTAHDALEDTKATLQCYKECLKLLESHAETLKKAKGL